MEWWLILCIIFGSLLLLLALGLSLLAAVPAVLEEMGVELGG